MKIYLKTFTIIIINKIKLLTIRVYLHHIIKYTFFNYYSIFPVEILVCEGISDQIFNQIVFSFFLRIIVVINCFFVLNSLSIPLEITVLPMKTVISL